MLLRQSLWPLCFSSLLSSRRVVCVCSGVVIAGRKEYQEEQAALARAERVASLKEQLAWKWSLEDFKAQKRAANKAGKKGKEEEEKKPVKAFGSRGYRQEAQARQRAVTAQRKRKLSLTINTAKAADESADDDAEMYVTPKRRKSSISSTSLRPLWPNAAITPSPVEARRTAAAAARAHTAAPAQFRGRDNTAPVRSVRRRPLVLPSKDATSAHDNVQPIDDGEVPAIFRSIAASRAAAAAAAAAQSGATETEESEAEAAAVDESPVIKRPATSTRMVRDVPLPHRALLRANWAAGKLSLTDEAEGDEPKPSATKPTRTSSVTAPLPARSRIFKRAVVSQPIDDQDPFAFDG